MVLDRANSKKSKLALSAYSEFFNNSPIPCYMKDTDLRYLAASENFAVLTNAKSVSDLIGKTDEELFGTPEHLLKQKELELKVIETGEPCEDIIIPIEIKEMARTIYCKCSKRPIKDNKGKVIGIIGTSEDCTMTYEAELRFKKQSEIYMALPNNALCCAFIDVSDWKMLDFTAIKDGRVVHMDMSVGEFITRSDRLISVDISEHRYFANLDRENIMKKYNEGLTGTSTEFFVNTEEFPSRWVNYEYFFLVNPKNDHVCILFSVLDISKQREEKDSLIKAAEQDLMTGVLNHESAMNKIDFHIHSEGLDQLNALFMIDVDNFKEINDHFGHRTGDNVLVDIAQKITKTFRDTDIVGRVGGDEFIVLMKNLDKAWMANNKAQELINTLQYDCQRNGESVLMTSSVGVVVFTGGKAPLEDLYSEADAALYKAKNLGKNRFVFSEDSDIKSFALEAPVADISVNLQTVLDGIDGVFIIAEVREDELIVLYSSNPLYSQDVIESMPAEEYNALLYTIKKASVLEKGDVDYTASSSFDYRGQTIWLRVKGSFVEPDRANTLKLVALVTDIKEFKNTEQLLKRENTKNSLALSISNTITWDYDATTKLISLHDSDSLPIPYVDDNMVFPESREAYVKMYADIDSGVDQGTEFIHFNSIFGKNMWMQVSFKTTYNESRHVIGALFAAHDVTNFMKNMDKYDTARRRYTKALRDEKTAFHLNLTTDKVLSTSFCRDFFEPEEKLTDASAYLAFFRELIDSTGDRKEYYDNYYSVDNFLHLMNSNVDSLEEELFVKLTTNDSEWFLIRMFLVTNPETREKELFAHLKNINAEHTSQMIIDRIFDFEYEMLAVIDTKTSSIRILQDNSSRSKKNPEYMDYEDFLYASLDGYVVENEVMDCANAMDLRNLRKELNAKSVYLISFSVYENSLEQSEVLIKRKRYLYTYIDDAKRYIAVTKSDVTDQYKSEFDYVSGLYNRASFYAKAKSLIDSNPRTAFVIVRWDIDKFKIFNDIFGAKAGDELLAMIGNAYRDKEFQNDETVVGNLGGDNFAICMPANNFDPDEHLAFLTNLFEDLFENYTISFHMAGYRVTDTTLDIALMCDRAAIAIKSIKERASTKFVWYEESMRLDTVREQELITDLRTALQTEQFTIYIQPQFNQMTMKLVSGESLVRWVKPDGEVVPPNIFVPVLEKTGLITRVDQVVWEKTCEFLSRRKKEGKPNVPLAVNISRRDFYNSGFCNMIYDLIEKYDIEPSLLDLEVTESAYIENTDLIVATIDELRSHGFNIKMDDFGTGYSSLNTLKHVPVDMIKLDMNFLYNDDTDETSIFRGGVILDSMLRMAHWLGLPVIAEGVETAKQADFLKTIDCSIVQGFYFSKPLPLDEFEKMLDESSVDTSLSVFNLDNNFDNYDFWDPTAQTSLLFNTFIGPAGIFELYNGRLAALRLNGKFFKELKIRPEAIDFTTLNILQIVEDDDIERVQEVLNAASDTSEEQNIELRFPAAYPSKDKFIWLRIKIRRIAHTDKRCVFYISVENITKRKLLEQKNTNLAKLLSAVINSGSTGVFTYETGDVAVVTPLGIKHTAAYGFTEQEFYEKFNGNLIECIHPDDRDELRRILRTGDTEGKNSIRRDFRQICNDGTYKKAEFIIYKPSRIGGRRIGYFAVCDSFIKNG